MVFFWALARSMDVARQMLVDSAWIRDRPATRSLLQLGVKVGKLFLLAIAVVALLSELGYPVASLVAGLGIGGLAVALAAQKTLENLFGALAIGADQPFREGDFVRVDDILGTVEAIGLRSTRIRTLDLTLVTIPNGKLAEMRLENFALRDRLRLACTLCLVYGTTRNQLRAALAGVERVLWDHPKLWPEGVTVRLKELGESSLNIEVNACFQTSDWDEFAVIREETLLLFMDVVERAGSLLCVSDPHRSPSERPGERPGRGRERAERGATSSCSEWPDVAELVRGRAVTAKLLAATIESKQVDAVMARGWVTRLAAEPPRSRDRRRTTR
jgi:MscS family membrane protein